MVESHPELQISFILSDFPGATILLNLSLFPRCFIRAKTHFKDEVSIWQCFLSQPFANGITVLWGWMKDVIFSLLNTKHSEQRVRSWKKKKKQQLEPELSLSCPSSICEAIILKGRQVGS